MSITILSASAGHWGLTPYTPGWACRLRRKPMVEGAMLATRPDA
jgi:hypothetical protein